VSTAPLEILEIKKHVGAIHMKGGLSLLQRKAVNVLLLRAYDELPDDSVKEHTIRLSDLADTVGFNSNDHELLKATLSALVDVKVVWNVLDPEGRREWGVSALLASARIKEGTGVCRYAYTPPLRELLYNPAIYARINLAVQTRFTSGAALALYENCFRFRRTGSTGWISVDDWRGLLGVGDDQYPEYKRFRSKVLAPAIDQINEHSDIRVEMETRREKRRVAALRFAVAPAAAEPGALSDGELGENEAREAALRVRCVEFGLTASQIGEAMGLPPEQVERNLAHVEGDLARGKKIGKLGAYAYRAIAEDWAGLKRAADQTQASLFDGAAGGVAAQGTPSPPASEVVSGEAARRDREASEAARLDAVLAELDVEAQAVLDAEAVRALRGQAHPGWQEVERAIEGGLEDELGPANGGALRMARRDVVATWLERGA
jgi:hypothetical protein